MATIPGAVGRGGRVILSLAEKITQPQQCSDQVGEPCSYSSLLSEIQRWEADLWVEFRAFEHRQRRRGLFGSTRIHKRDADRALTTALREMAQGGDA